MYVKNQKFLILGMSKSGFSVCRYLLSNGAVCYYYEQKQNVKIDGYAKEVENAGAIRVFEQDVDEILNVVDVLVISPGVPINHDIAVRAKRKSVRIIGELEFGFIEQSPKIIAVTGTNGKTTTCTMIDKILEVACVDKYLVGNVGEPVTNIIEKVDRKSICVAEVSSFQLESVYSFCPHVSCVLNIAPDHLERHYTMENYVFLKKRIFKNQRESEYCVLNYDDQIVREFDAESQAKTVWISVKEKVDGAYLDGNKLCYKNEIIVDKDDLPFSGIHNVYNALFAIAVCKIFAVETKDIVSGLKEFKGVKHRIELVGNHLGVNFYNDSKSTNVASTLTALKSMTMPTILILGGREKGETYEDLFNAIKERPVKHVVLTGESRYNMLNAASNVGFSNLTVTNEFEYAVKIAKTFAEEGDNVLLSPACSSFDSFSGFEERGERFVKLIGEQS